MQKHKQKENERNYSLVSNLIYIYRAFFQDHGKKMYPVFLMRLTLNTVTFSILTALPAVAVSLIEQKKGIAEFTAVICGFAVLYALLLSLQVYTEQFYDISGTMSRCFVFSKRLIDKCLETDYVNRESNENQKLLGKAAVAAAWGNYYGIERMYKEVPDVVSNALGLLVYGGAILTVDIRILIVLLLMLVFNIKTNQFARTYMEETREEDTEIRRKFQYLGGKSTDITSGKDARIYRMEKWFGEVMDEYIRKGAAWQKRVEKRYYLPVASDTVFIALRDGLAYVLLIHMALEGEISAAVFTLMLGAVAGFSNWMFAMVNSWNSLLDANKPVSDFRRVMEIEDSFRHGEGKKADLSGEPPEIIFRDVSFRYPGETEDILSHINLHIRRGEKIALVGSNGAGKTTLVKLLCGFYHPTEGEILVNGVSIEDYDIESYFKLLGVVFQDTENLAYSLLEIVSGRTEEETDRERFWQAVKASGLYEKIQSLEKKERTCLTTVFDDNGIKLSGGEMQKLMLARCIYKDAPVMILDEPTAALDPIAESRLYEEYRNMAEDKTSIFISHRLASTRFCNRILFLENGRIAEEGAHEELLSLGGRYAKIYEIQSHYYREDSKKNSVDMEAAYDI